MRESNYDKYPSIKISGRIIRGWNFVISELAIAMVNNGVLAVDLYPGVREDVVWHQLQNLDAAICIDTRQLMKPETEIRRMTDRYMTDDVLFGYLSGLSLDDYFDADKVRTAKHQIAAAHGQVVVMGTGASRIVPEGSTLVYVDMARWEIQQRFRAHEVKALGIDNRDDAVSIQYKRGYFNDWRVADSYKEQLFGRIDYWLDTHIADDPRMIDNATFMAGIDATVRRPFRVVPFFDPAPWGGQWMKRVCGLDPS